MNEQQTASAARNQVIRQITRYSADDASQTRIDRGYLMIGERPSPRARKLASALAITLTVIGLVGFFASLATSPIPDSYSVVFWVIILVGTIPRVVFWLKGVRATAIDLDNGLVYHPWVRGQLSTPVGRADEVTELAIDKPDRRSSKVAVTMELPVHGRPTTIELCEFDSARRAQAFERHIRAVLGLFGAGTVAPSDK